MHVNILKAFNGDLLWLTLHNNNDTITNIIIDSGPGNAYQFKNKKGKLQAGELQKLINYLRENGQFVDLLILTHVDDDHIGGLLKWFKKDEDAKNLIKKVWFNSGRLIAEHFKQEDTEENVLFVDHYDGFDTSIKQGAKFEDLLEENNLWDRRLIKALDQIEVFGLKFHFLSPDYYKLDALLGKWNKEAPITDTSGKNDYGFSLNEHISHDVFVEDKSIHNGSSIGFILDYNGKKAVFLGDAHPIQVTESLKDLGYSREEPLKAEFLKVSHHGSKANTNYELLELIDTDNYIISSNGDKHQLPDKQSLARIINHNNKAKICFNYPEMINEIFKPEDYEAFPGFLALDIEKGFKL